MKNSMKIKRLVGIATLAALVAVLQVISNYITFGTVSITLALIPMVIGAILYGPLVGFGLGAFMGVIIITAPSTTLFLGFNAFLTILLCILKTGLAGLASGFIFRGICKLNFLKQAKFPVAIVVATLVAPLINTGLFILGSAVLFRGISTVVEDVEYVLIPSNGSFGDAMSGAVALVMLTNFLIEFTVSVVLSPSIIYIFKILGSKYNVGYQDNFVEAAQIQKLNLEA